MTSGAAETSKTTVMTSVRGAMFLGVGPMVGAGIFALLGEAGAVAGRRLDLVLAGRDRRRPDRLHRGQARRPLPVVGGLIAYLIAGFGNGRVVGIASWLGYIAAIVIVGAMVAVSFGSYATALFIGNDAGASVGQRVHTAVVVGTLAINIIGSRIVDRAQTAISSPNWSSSRLHRRDHPRRGLEPARVQGLSAG